MKHKTSRQHNSNGWIACLALLFLTIFITSFETSGQGTVSNIQFYSQSLEMERNIQVYLPEGYNEQDAVTYPVIYFLHGAGQNSTSHSELLTAYNNLIDNKEILPCIIVKPDGSCPPWGRSYFTNSELYGNFEDYIVYDLVTYIDSAYNTVSARDKRAIMGYSMGAYGAMKLALKHPDLFSGVAAHSGMLNMRMCSQYIPALLSENGGAPVLEYNPDAGSTTYGAIAIAGALSPNLDHPPYFVDFPLDSMGNWIDSVWNRWSAENCPFLARNLTEEDDMAIYFDCGEQDEVLAYAFNTSFADSLDQLGIPYEFQSFTGGHYNQLFTRLPIALQFLDSVMNPEIEADTCAWTFKAPMPTARGFTTGAILDGKIYMTGGYTSNNSTTSATESFDPGTNTWTSRANMPEGRVYHASCSCNGKIYVFGGLTPDMYGTAQDNVYEYNPDTDTWTQKADMPISRGFCAISVVNDTIYLMGGGLQIGSTPNSTVMAYSPVTDSWSEKASMPTARFCSKASVVDGKIYVIGGTNQNYSSVSYKVVEIYDPETNTWTLGSDMPTGRFGLGTCVVNGKIYAVGGMNSGNVLTTNEIYDPASDTWKSIAPLQQKRFQYFVGATGDIIYAIGGAYPNPQNPMVPVVLSSVEAYTPCTETTGIDESRQNTKMPGDITISQNYPNPFFQHTTIPFSLQSRQKIGLNVFNIQGQQVAELVNEVKSPGDYTPTFDSGNLTEGIYFIRFMAGNYTQTIKCVLLRQ